ncbi:Os04g0163700, partial [Oryza sativa Japonica Group]
GIDLLETAIVFISLQWHVNVLVGSMGQSFFYVDSRYWIIKGKVCICMNSERSYGLHERSYGSTYIV